MVCEDRSELLHQYGLKSTKPRNSVLHVLVGQNGALTAEEIYQALLRAGTSVNFSTVYRVLELFAAKGLVRKNFFPDLRSCGFSLMSVGHTHHLICMRCHKKIDISHCPLGDFEAVVAADTGFEIKGHNLELYGYCEKCRHETGGYISAEKK